MPYVLNGDDWFEIFNPAPLPVALAGLYVTDNPSISGITNHTIVPYSYVGPGGWVRLYADSDVGAGRDHVNFRLADLGETLRLYDSNFQLIDSVEFGPVPAQMSEGRIPDGGDRIVGLPFPTPLGPNVLPLPHVTINELLINPDALTEQAIELYNSSSQAVDISHWWLSDSAVVPKKFRIPPGTVIPPAAFKSSTPLNLRLETPIFRFCCQPPVKRGFPKLILPATSRALARRLIWVRFHLLAHMVSPRALDRGSWRSNGPHLASTIHERRAIPNREGCRQRRSGTNQPRRPSFGRALHI
jgi:hypothetical protein